jgi:uncharacterized protein (DUF1499 family)
MSTLTISMPGKPLRICRVLAGLTLWVGALCAVAVLLAGPAYRAEWLPLGAALQTVRWGATVAIGAAVVALVALLLLIAQRSPPQLRLWAAAALVLNAVVAGPPLLMYSRLQQLPRIHDITTNPDNPPTFEAVVPLRKAAKNPVTYAPAVAAEQRKGYPDIQPLMLPLPPPAAFDRAAEAARAMGWDIVAVAPDKGRLEATDTTVLFGFKDDVVVRVMPQGQGSVVDVRSLSRVGGSDFGTNAQRVRKYLKRVAESMATP